MTCEMAQRAIALAAMAANPELSGPEEHSRPHELEDDEAFYEGLGEAPFDEHAGLGLPPSLFTAEAVSTDREPGLPPLPDHRLPIRHSSSVEDLTDSPAGCLASELRAVAGPPPAPGHTDSALAAHLAECRTCQAEMAATTAFFRALAQETGPELSPSLLARSRMRLDASLDSCEQSPFPTRIAQQLAFSAGRLRAAPVLCSALLLTGLLAGGYGGYHAGHAAHAAEQTALLLAPPAPEVPSVVADVSSISRDPGTNLVEVRYDRLVPDVLTAPADDPSIRALLMAATENGTDPNVRNLSVNLLSGGCHPGAPCDGTPVRDALLNVLSSDKTPQVRREALASLEPFIATDMQVRDAVLAALMGDPSASVRIEAVRLLQPVDVDSSVRQVLHTVAAEDGDPTIRSASLAALKAVPQVQ